MKKIKGNKIVCSVLLFVTLFLVPFQLTNTRYNTISFVFADEVTGTCNGLIQEPLKTDLENVLKIIRIIGPILVIVLTTYELIGAVISKDADALKKATSKLATRIVLVLVLFFLPTIINFVLGLVDARYSTCIS